MQPLIDIRYGILALPQTSTQTMVVGPVPRRLAAKACASQPSFKLAPQHRVLVSHPNSAKGTPKRSASLGYDVHTVLGRRGTPFNCRECRCDGHRSQRPGSVVAETLRASGKFLSLNFLLHKGLTALSSDCWE